MGNYYVGINGTNVICNEDYFDGYITAYPIGERGNISFYPESSTKEKLDEEKFGVWVKQKILEILEKDPNSQFTFFNKKMASICSFLSDANIEGHNDWELLAFLNDKFQLRDHLKDNVRMLDYLKLKGSQINYNNLVGNLGGNHFVLQSATGSGGLTTHNISSSEDLKGIKLQDDTEYSISAYQENIPMNATLMITSQDIHQLPVSVQLIKNTGNFIYCGGDFVFPKSFKFNITEQVERNNEIIGRELQKLGYRGICGVDYIICPDGVVKFMELNPRFQGSSFLLSMALKRAKTSIARLNAECFNRGKVDLPDIDMSRSFVNCKLDDDFKSLGRPDQIIKKVEGSTFRKIFNRSICLEDSFERPEDLTFICCK